MLPILSTILAVLALAASAFTLLTIRGLRNRLRQREDDLAQAIAVFGVKQENDERAIRDLQERLPQALSGVERLQETVAELEERFQEVESYAGVCVPPRPAPSGLNLNRRVEAVRLLREGATEEQVAAELSLALSEVRLISHLERSKPAPVTKRRRGAA
jgi:uncharacterized coiled-coil protein SlyX